MFPSHYGSAVHQERDDYIRHRLHVFLPTFVLFLMGSKEPSAFEKLHVRTTVCFSGTAHVFVQPQVSSGFAQTQQMCE